MCYVLIQYKTRWGCKNKWTNNKIDKTQYWKTTDEQISLSVHAMYAMSQLWRICTVYTVHLSLFFFLCSVVLFKKIVWHQHLVICKLSKILSWFKQQQPVVCAFFLLCQFKIMLCCLIKKWKLKQQIDELLKCSLVAGLIQHNTIQWSGIILHWPKMFNKHMEQHFTLKKNVFLYIKSLGKFYSHQLETDL